MFQSAQEQVNVLCALLLVRVLLGVGERLPESLENLEAKLTGSGARCPKRGSWCVGPPDHGHLHAHFARVPRLHAWKPVLLFTVMSTNEFAATCLEVSAQLTQGQQARSASFICYFETSFQQLWTCRCPYSSFPSRCASPHSPQKPFGDCGFELLRGLSLEFALRTRTEAVCLRQELWKREFRLDTKSARIVSDLHREMSDETARYDELCSTLPQSVSCVDLALSESDQAMILVRNLPSDARQYVLLHVHDDSLTALKQAGLKYERQQRLYNELGAIGGRLRELQPDELADEEAFDEGWVEAVAGVKRKRCGKKHETSSCTTNGHIWGNCKNPSRENQPRKR